MKPSQELIARAREVQQMTTNFCNRHLTDEYTQLCEKLINKVLRSPSASVLMNGRAISIAAGIIQVISANNFLSKSRLHPINGDMIALAFGVSAANMAAKAALIRKAANVKTYHDPDYASPEAMDNSLDLKMRTTFDPMLENLRKVRELNRSK